MTDICSRPVVAAEPAPEPRARTTGRRLADRSAAVALWAAKTIRSTPASKRDKITFVIRSVEQTNIDQHENVVMRQVAPAEIDRGDYPGWSSDGVVLPQRELGALPSPSTPQVRQEPRDQAIAR